MVQVGDPSTSGRLHLRAPEGWYREYRDGDVDLGTVEYHTLKLLDDTGTWRDVLTMYLLP